MCSDDVQATYSQTLDLGRELRSDAWNFSKIFLRYLRAFKYHKGREAWQWSGRRLLTWILSLLLLLVGNVSVAKLSNSTALSFLICKISYKSLCVYWFFFFFVNLVKLELCFPEFPLLYGYSLELTQRGLFMRTGRQSKGAAITFWGSLHHQVQWHADGKLPTVSNLSLPPSTPYLAPLLAYWPCLALGPPPDAW